MYISQFLKEWIVIRVNEEQSPKACPSIDVKDEHKVT